MGLLIQPFEMETGKEVMLVRVRGMGFGMSMKVHRWMVKGRRRKETGIGREIGVQTQTEMVLIQKGT